MLNGMGPWIFASIVFIGMAILLYRLLNIVRKHLHENSTELKGVNTTMTNIMSLLQQGMMLMNQRNMEARESNKSKSEMK